MPGYTMHLAEASQLLPKLGKYYPVADPVWRNRFLIGTLLPDTKIREGKQYTHFWNPDDLVRLARAPEMARFYRKYGARLEEPCMLGYWAHLYLDTCYVNSYWPSMLTFYDENGRESDRMDEIRQVRIAKSGELVPVGRFYSVDYYYGDYNRMNGYFFGKYPIEVPVWDEDLDPGMEEVEIRHMHRVLGEMEQLVASLPATKEEGVRQAEQAKAFDVPDFDRFIMENGKEFLKALEEYRADREGFVQNHSKTK